MCAASLIAGAEGSQVRLRVVSGSGRESEMLVRRQPAPPVSKEMLARAEEAAQVFLGSGSGRDGSKDAAVVVQRDHPAADPALPLALFRALEEEARNALNVSQCLRV